MPRGEARRPGAAHLGQGRRLQARREAVGGGAETSVAPSSARRASSTTPARTSSRQALPRSGRPRPRDAAAVRLGLALTAAKLGNTALARRCVSTRSSSSPSVEALAALAPLAQRGARQGGDGSAQEGVRPEPGATLGAQHVGEPLRAAASTRRRRRWPSAPSASPPPPPSAPIRASTWRAASRAGRLQVGARVVHPGDGRIPLVRAAHLRARPDAPQVWG